MQFPLPYVPTTSYKGGNGFNAARDAVREGLRHAANDLAAPAGTPVLAMCEGIVVSEPYLFFFETYALEVRHPEFIARYCEIARNTEVRAGDRVKEGQVIAYVGDQPGPDMLHLEFYRGELNGPLTVMNHPPYDRRNDVFNGGPILDRLVHTVTYREGDKFAFWNDQDGVKFLVPKFLVPIGKFVNELL